MKLAYSKRAAMSPPILITGALVIILGMAVEPWQNHPA